VKARFVADSRLLSPDLRANVPVQSNCSAWMRFPKTFVFFPSLGFRVNE
jgi:hypothetical protein